MAHRETEKPLELPSSRQLILPVFRALKELGSSGTVSEIKTKITELAGLTDKQLEVPHAGAGANTEIDYRLHWARAYLKKYGVIDNSERGVWVLTSKGIALETLDPKEVVRQVNQQIKAARDAQTNSSKAAIGDHRDESAGGDFGQDTDNWKSTLNSILLRLSSSGFERLVQRLLRESGFTEVVVTGKKDDGGIDRKGIIRLGGLLSFPIIFQAKKWKGSVGAKEIRDFRGAMVGRVEKGLFVTTGTFTPAAEREAARDGAPLIDLVDGDQLLTRLKELGVGVKIRVVQSEEVEVDHDWFKTLEA